MDVCLICLGSAADDPRVRKQGDYLTEIGLSVGGLCSQAARANRPAWPEWTTDSPGPSTVIDILRRAMTGDAGDRRFLVARPLQAFAGLSWQVAQKIYWSRPVFQQMLELGRQHPCKIYVANDWMTLPLAATLAAETGGVYIYDSHEYACDELPESMRWRILTKPLVISVEKHLLPAAKIVSTVSDGIAGFLHRDHRLSTTPLVMRNVPGRYVPRIWPDAKPAGAKLTYLYHGHISQHRRLDVLVDSVAKWHPSARLVLRGPGPQHVLDGLAQQVTRLGLGERISIEPPVPLDHVVSAAMEADVGIVALPHTSRQNDNAMPNKIFEYVHAGLAVLTPNLAEASRFVQSNDIGTVCNAYSAEAIAHSVNAWQRDEIERLKIRSRALAPQLVWSEEAEQWGLRILQIVRNETPGLAV